MQFLEACLSILHCMYHNWSHNSSLPSNSPSFMTHCIPALVYHILHQQCSLNVIPLLCICTNQQGSCRMYILQIMPSLLICTTTSTNQVLPYFQQLVQPVLPRVSSWLELGNLLGVIQSVPYQTNNFNQISFNIFSFTIASLLGNRGTNYHHRRIQIQFLVASWWEKVA